MEFRNLEIELNNIAQEITEEYKNKLLQSKATGNLISSVTVDLKRYNNNYKVSLNLAEYWKYIENGRQPGTFPNVSSLITWIRAKGIQPQGRMTVEQLAYVIGNKIKRDGIQAKPYLKESVNSINDLGPRLGRALLNDLMDNNNFNLNNRYAQR